MQRAFTTSILAVRYCYNYVLLAVTETSTESVIILQSRRLQHLPPAAVKILRENQFLWKLKVNEIKEEYNLKPPLISFYLIISGVT